MRSHECAIEYAIVNNSGYTILALKCLRSIVSESISVVIQIFSWYFYEIGSYIIMKFRQMLIQVFNFEGTWNKSYSLNSHAFRILKSAVAVVMNLVYVIIQGCENNELFVTSTFDLKKASDRFSPEKVGKKFRYYRFDQL